MKNRGGERRSSRDLSQITLWLGSGVIFMHEV